MVNFEVAASTLRPSSKASVSLSERSILELHPPPELRSNSCTVNTATRPIHSQLNRLILLRLPLALPPQTSNPSTYVSGLLHIAPIYANFESLWESLLASSLLPISSSQNAPTYDSESLTPASKSHDTPGAHGPEACSRILSFLKHLRMPGLLRAQRLRDDISQRSFS